MLAMMALYALLHYVQERRVIYGQYAFYIGCMILDFRLADWGYQQPDYMPGAYFPETLVESVAYMLYIRFAILLMNLPQRDPISYRITQQIIRVFVIALLIDALLVIGGADASVRSTVYMVNRGVACLGGLYVTPRIFRLRDRVVRYFVAGSLCLVLCSVIALLGNYLPISRWVSLEQRFVFPVTILQIGVVVEVLCFTLGVSLRNRQTEHEKLVVQDQLIEQLRENEQKQQKLQRIRADIARDLHDDLGSDLSGISLLSRVAAGQLTERPDEARTTLHLIGETARKVISTMRGIVWSLNSTQQSIENVSFRLKETAYTLFEHQPTELHLDLPTEPCDDLILPENRRELFLMYKEMLHNVIRHARAQHVHIRLVVFDQMLCLTVRDDGAGFEVSTNAHTGNGLASLRQRTTTLNGQLTLDSQPGRGTTITFCGPIAVPVELEEPVKATS